MCGNSVLDMFTKSTIRTSIWACCRCTHWFFNLAISASISLSTSTSTVFRLLGLCPPSAPIDPMGVPVLLPGVAGGAAPPSSIRHHAVVLILSAFTAPGPPAPRPPPPTPPAASAPAAAPCGRIPSPVFADAPTEAADPPATTPEGKEGSPPRGPDPAIPPGPDPPMAPPTKPPAPEPLPGPAATPPVKSPDCDACEPAGTPRAVAPPWTWTRCIILPVPDLETGDVSL